MYFYSNYLYIMLYCLIITIILECSVSFIIGMRKKDLLNVFLINLITNPLVNSIQPLFLFYFNKNYQQISLIVLEVLVLLSEGLFYKKVLNYKKINAFGISLLLNVISFILGELIFNILFR